MDADTIDVDADLDLDVRALRHRYANAWDRVAALQREDAGPPPFRPRLLDELLAAYDEETDVAIALARAVVGRRLVGLLVAIRLLRGGSPEPSKAGCLCCAKLSLEAISLKDPCKCRGCHHFRPRADPACGRCGATEIDHFESFWD